VLALLVLLLLPWPLLLLQRQNSASSDCFSFLALSSLLVSVLQIL
jgi:hypothetical protein